jgi:hypothetical protein
MIGYFDDDIIAYPRARAPVQLRRIPQYLR